MGWWVLGWSVCSLLASMVMVAVRQVERWRARRHVHEWVYFPRTGTGWGMVFCRTCGYHDLY